MFADASVKAIAAVGYLKVADLHGHTDVNFLFGKSKLAPQPDITGPRLELCAAVLVVEIAELIVESVHLHNGNMFHTELNRADYGSRSVPADFLGSTSWLTVPHFLHNSQFRSESQESLELVDPASDSEICPQVYTNLTEAPKFTWNSERFIRFSNFNTLIRAIARLIYIANSFSKKIKRC